MKIDAISSRGSRRDFVDLYFIFQNLNLGLKEFFKYFEEKYGKENYNIFHVLKSLVYFEDAEREPELNMLDQFSWENVKNFFIELSSPSRLSALLPLKSPSTSSLRLLRRERSISEGLCGCFLSILREKSILGLCVRLFLANCCDFVAINLAVLAVILSFQDVSGR